LREVRVAEVFVEFETAVAAPDGRVYLPRACGRPMGDGTGLWEGWIEFLPAGDAPPLRSPRETTQPNRRDVEYWATGLTPVYLEGAFERALRALRPPVAAPQVRPPAFEGPAASRAETPGPAGPSVLDPFSVYEKGEALLRRELAALASWHLVNIIRAYRLSDSSQAALQRLASPELIELIVAAVRARSRELTGR
jgi:hypothetical protein